MSSFCVIDDIKRYKCFDLLLFIPILFASTGEPAAREKYAAYAEQGVIKVSDADSDDVSAAPIDVTDAFGEPDKPLALQIELFPYNASPSYVTVSGVPPEFKISAGFHTGTRWYLSTKDLEALTITAPSTFEGRFPIEVRLHGPGNVLAGYGKAFVTIANPTSAKSGTASGNAKALSQVKRDAIQPEQPKADETKLSRQDETALLARAEALLKSADLAAARLILENLARRGSPKAAYSLARTYDPAFFKSTFIKGMLPDPAKAKVWYQKATL